jgi:hypothetical protein
MKYGMRKPSVMRMKSVEMKSCLTAFLSWIMSLFFSQAESPQADISVMPKDELGRIMTESFSKKERGMNNVA